MPQNKPVDEKTKSNVLSAFGKLPLHFVANQGQLNEAVVYYAKSEGVTVYCTEEGLVFGFPEGSISLKFNAIANPSMSLRAQRSNPEAKQSLRVKPEARGRLEGKVNYFVGNDPALWQTDIPIFKEVVYREVYPGIDLVYNGDQRRLKYTFYLQPNSHPTQILMTYEGIESLCVDDVTGMSGVRNNMSFLNSRLKIFGLLWKKSVMNTSSFWRILTKRLFGFSGL